MAFSRETDVTKTSIEDMSISLFSPGANNVINPQSGDIDILIGLSSGETMSRRYDLIARLNDDATGQQHLANLADLRDYLKNRLNNEVLP